MSQTFVLHVTDKVIVSRNLAEFNSKFNNSKLTVTRSIPMNWLEI